jgi:aspartate aminotransferase
MEGVLRLHFGESNLPTPAYIKEAAIQALAAGFTFYTENAGLPELRTALAGKYWDLHRVALDPTSEIMVTASGVQALHMGIRLVLNPGDEALLLTPAWPNASAIVMMCSAIPREVPMGLQKERYEIDYDRLEAAVTPRTRLLVVTSPSNPLGWVATPGDQSRLLEFSIRHRLWLLADEVYERLYYKGSVAPSILRICSRKDPVLVVQSFSKTYCMTGWRLGWLVGREDAARKAVELNEFVVSHAPTMAQKAGEVALLRGEDELKTMMGQYRSNLDFCLSTLKGMEGIDLPEPEGAFYLFPRIRGLSDSFEFCRVFLQERKVSLAPGVAFGAGGEGSVRICFAADMTVLQPAMERLKSFLLHWREIWTGDSTGHRAVHGRKS